jgi:hypothetical protein
MNESGFSKPDKPSYYPSVFASPEEKATKEYALKTAKALYWNNWNSAQNAYGNNQRSKWIDTRAWSNGQFDVQSFVGGRKPKGQRDKNPLLKHLDFDPVTEQPKYRDIIVGYLEELDFEIIATTINPAAKAKKEEKKIREIATLKAKQAGVTQQLNQTAGRPMMPDTEMDFAPDSVDEIEMYYTLGGYKEIAELEIELGAEIVQNDSDWKAIKKLLLEDAFDTGRMAIDTEYDKTGRMKYKYVDMVNCGVEDYRGHYLKRPCRIWYVELVTVSELLIDSNGQFTMDEAEALAKMYENKFGNPVWNNNYTGWQTYINTDTTYSYFWYNYKIPRMKMYWEELDYYKQKETSMPKYGKKRVEPASKENPEGGQSNPDITFNEFGVHNYYTCKWIVNTDYVYDYGKVPFQARDPYDIRFALCPLKYYRVANQAPGERVKAYCKKIYMTWNKIDQEVASKIPSGYKINVRALENISLGQSETFTVKHAIELVNETGRLVYADEALADDFGRTIKKDPIEVFDTSTPFKAAIEGWQMLINFYEERINKVLGFSDLMDGSTPNANMPATLAKLAVQGAKNSLSQIAGGLLDIAEKGATDVTERIRLIVQEQGEYSGYADALGTGLIEAQRVTQAVVPHRFAIKIQAKPTAQEREKMKEYIAQSFASLATPQDGGLWVGDVLHFSQLVDSGTNMKLVRVMMEARQKENLKKVQEAQLQNIQAQGEINSKNTQDAEQAKLMAYSETKKIDLLYEQGLTAEIIKRTNAEVAAKTQAKLVDQEHKSGLKVNEEVVKSQLGA